MRLNGCLLSFPLTWSYPVAKVDPFVIQWPEKWTSDPEINPVINYLNRFLHDLFIRSGGGEDLLDSTEQALTSSNSRVSRNAAKINALEKVDFEVEPITADFTTFRNQIIICKNTSSINVTLDPQALQDDIVTIKRRGAKVTIIGTINGKTDLVINVKQNAPKLAFDGVDWSTV